VLEEIERQHLRRRRATVDDYPEKSSHAQVIVDGRRLVDFSSNDYLGLAAHPALAAAMIECATRCGAGSGASHLISGHGREHAALEEELAAFVGRPRALLFSTGYMANLGVVTALAGRGESVLLDRLSHASLIDGGLLSCAPPARREHTTNDRRRDRWCVQHGRRYRTNRGTVSGCARAWSLARRR
jgi:8-amino-7-oxononanoate synthase